MGLQEVLLLLGGAGGAVVVVRMLVRAFADNWRERSKRKTLIEYTKTLAEGERKLEQDRWYGQLMLEREQRLREREQWQREVEQALLQAQLESQNGSSRRALPKPRRR